MPRSTRLCAVALAMGLTGIAPAALAVEAIQCEVEAIDGAEARLWAGGAWGPLEAGADIPRDAIVVTGEETRARIVCSDGLVLTVGVATEINLETLAGQRTDRVAQLVRGILGVLSPRRLRESLLVRTPVASASIGASDALVEFAPEKGASVFVREGEAVGVAHGAGKATLGAGEGITVDDSGDAAPVKRWGEDRIRVSAEALGFDWLNR